MRRAAYAVGSLVILAALCRCPSAFATEPDEPASYQRLIEDALDAVARSDWEVAYSKFERAASLTPSARALRGMAVVSYRLHRYARALVLAQRAVREPNMALDSDLRAASEKLARDAAEHVGYRVLEGSTPGSTVTVDGEPAWLDDEHRLVLDEGEHTVKAEAKGYVSKVATMRVAAHETERWAVDLEPVRPTSESPTRGAPRPPSDAEPPKPVPVRSEHPRPRSHPAHARSESPSHTVTWIAAAGVPIFLAGAGLAWSRTQSIGDGLAQRCAALPCTRAQRASYIENSDLGTYETLTNVSLAVAVASGVVAVVAYAIEGRRPDKPVTGVAAPETEPLTLHF